MSLIKLTDSWDIAIPKNRQRFNPSIDCSLCKDTTIDSAIMGMDKEFLDGIFRLVSKTEWLTASCGHKMHHFCVFMELRREILEEINVKVHPPFRNPSEASGEIIRLHDRIEKIWKKHGNTFFCNRGCHREVSIPFEALTSINTAIREVPFNHDELSNVLLNQRLHDLVINALQIRY